MSINMINTSRPFEISSSIIEWDMKRAGLNLIKEHNLLSDSKIKELEMLPKKESDIVVGKLQIKDKDFSKRLDQAFTDAMNHFLEANKLDIDFDVLSIKKDACFVINKEVKYNSFGKYIKFVKKNEYHAYMYLKPLEIYFKKNGEVDIKGLVGDRKVRETILELHKNGILNFLLYIIELAEKSGMNKRKINKCLHEFVSMYKNRELDFDYYREFNVESRFRYQLLDTIIMADNIDANMLGKINIEYNYIHIILPIINLLC